MGHHYRHQRAKQVKGLLNYYSIQLPRLQKGLSSLDYADVL